MIELALNILRAGYLLLNMSRAVGVYFEVTSKQLCGGTGFWVSGFSNSEAVWLWFRVTVANDLAHRELMSDEAD